MEISGCATAPEAWPTIQLDERRRESSTRNGGVFQHNGQKLSVEPLFFSVGHDKKWKWPREWKWKWAGQWKWPRKPVWRRAVNASLSGPKLSSCVTYASNQCAVAAPDPGRF
eukprot:scaffold739_cov166-Pinguiococcus_pyrenoidosus.AAC.12